MGMCIALCFNKHTYSATIIIICSVFDGDLNLAVKKILQGHQVRCMPLNFIGPFILQVRFFLYSAHAKLPNLNPTNIAFWLAHICSVIT